MKWKIINVALFILTFIFAGFSQTVTLQGNYNDILYYSLYQQTPYNVGNPWSKKILIRPDTIIGTYFTTNLQVDKPTIYNFGLNMMYVLPEDSIVSLDYYLINNKDSVVAKSIFPGNYTYYNFRKSFDINRITKIKLQKHETFQQFFERLNGAFDTLNEATKNYTLTNPVSNDFKDIIFKELKYDLFTESADAMATDSTVADLAILPDVSKDIINDSALFYLASPGYIPALTAYYILPYWLKWDLAYENVLKIKNSDIREYLFTKLLSLMQAYSVKEKTDSLAAIIMANVTRDAAKQRLKEIGYDININENKLLANIFLINEKGEKVKLSDIYNKNNAIIYLDIWASWCGPCIEESPHLERLRNKYSDAELQIITLSIDKFEKDWKKAYPKHLSFNKGNNYLLADAASRKQLLDICGSVEVPQYFILDHTGKIINKKANRPSDINALSKKIESKNN